MLCLLSKAATRASALLVVVLLATGGTAPLCAQATTVTLHGTITGTDGSAPQGAQVEVRDRETNVARGAFADREGTYHVLGLAPGTYDVTVRAIGYRQQRREAVRLVLGQRAVLDFTLERGAVELEPTVTTAEHVFDVHRSDVSTAVVQEEIEKLPLNSRNMLNLAAITPGVRTYATEAGTSMPAIGSLPGPRFLNFYADGVELKAMFAGNIIGGGQRGSHIPQESIREFRIYLNPYEAEYTRGASWVISAVTHRGGNDLEGSLFSYFQNSDLVSRGSFEATKPEYRRHQLGGNVRGPVMRDRLFFSLSYEGQITDDFVTVVPGRPQANPAIWDSLAGTFKAPHRLHAGLLRLTAPRGSHTFDAIWITRHLRSESDFGVRFNNVMTAHEAALAPAVRLNSVQLRDTYTSTALVNELSIHILDSKNDIPLLIPGPRLLYPNIQVGRTVHPLYIRDRYLRAINKTSYTRGGPRGQHVIKSGVELTRVRTSVYQPQNAAGFFDFATDTSTQPRSAHIGIGLVDPTSTSDAWGTIDGWLVGAYLQDQWHPVPSLTITAGLRYDAEINTLNQHFITRWANDTTLRRAFGEEYLNTGDRENDLDNIAPRLAVTWDALGNGRTFIRGGYGVLYDRVALYGAMAEKIGSTWAVYRFRNPGTTDPAELRRRVADGDTSGLNIILLPDRLETPANHQWSVGIGQQLSDALALNLDYVNQHVKTTYVSIRTNLQRMIPQYGDITLWDDFGDAKFRGLLASLTYDRRPTRLNVAYTLGWSESEFAGTTTSDYPDSAAYAMQRSEGDERHRLAVSGLTQLPFGIDISGIAIVASPRPFLAAVGLDVNQNGTNTDDWPNGIRTHRRDGWDHWYRTVDLRLGKSFPMRGGRLTVTAEVFNAFNWGNHSEYQATETAQGYGEPVADYPRRQGQLGVRYQF